MEKILKSIVIDAPSENVFDYLSNARHLPEVSRGIVEVKNVIATPDGAQSFDWTYRLAGIRFHGHAETVEVVKDRYQLVRNETGIPGTYRWTVGKCENGTEARLEIDHYELPIPFLGRLTAPILRRLNEHEADTLLRNLKARLETT
jgi:uncharacterized protein YndB with AHSA1/START domain